VESGIGTLVLDARAKARRNEGYTFPALVTRKRSFEKKPEWARAAHQGCPVRAKALKEDPNRATASAASFFRR